MIRIIAFLLLLAGVAFGLSWLLDHPGRITVEWLSQRIETSVFVALGAVFLLCVLFTILWNLLSFALRLPSLMSLARRTRRRARAHDALTRGVIAVGAGDLRTARRAADEASNVARDEPLTLLLRAQVAQMEGDRARAEQVFGAMAQREETRLLGLRGLHMEARRKGDGEAAQHFAREAQRAAPLAWAGEAVVAHHAARGEWEEALNCVETNSRARAVDSQTADRQRAVIETALAQDKEFTDSERASQLARDAAKRAPDLVPAVTLAARLLSRKGDFRGASKLIERAWDAGPHPELAGAYLDVRPGDSSADRFSRATALARRIPDHSESRMVVAEAALAMRDFARAREAMAPLVAEGARPSVRMCLLMADIEETEHGETGALREWLARASRAPRDPAWVADGVTASRWAPVSPVSGKLDAFRWDTPREEEIAPPREPLTAPVTVEAAPRPQLPVVVSEDGDETAASQPMAARHVEGGDISTASAASAPAEASPKPDEMESVKAAAVDGAPAPVTLPHIPPDDPGPRPSGAPYSGGFR